MTFLHDTKISIKIETRSDLFKFAWYLYFYSHCYLSREYEYLLRPALDPGLPRPLFSPPRRLDFYHFARHSCG